MLRRQARFRKSTFQEVFKRYGDRRSLLGPFRVLVAGIALASTVSCSNLAGPEYQRPEVPTKTAWSGDGGQGVSATETIRPEWWSAFGDPYLDELVQRAIAESIDLRILAARIDVAGAAIGAEKAGLLPRLTQGASAQYQRESGTTTKQFSAETSLSWEIDVWGKVRKGVSSKKAEYQASEADWRAGYLTLVSDVATRYFDIRQFDEQIDSQKRSLENNRRTLDIYRAQYAEGLIPKSQVLRQEAEVSNVTKDLVDLRRQRKVAELGLATLLGMPAGNLSVPVGHLRKTVRVLDVPPGLPSDLLARRPDIIAQEYRVLAAHELVGQAKLARLPSISLSGSAGSASDVLSGLLKTWTFGLSPSINIPIFDPSIQANIRSNEATTRVAEEEYRQTVIRAFEEVETSLVNLASRKQQRVHLEEQVKNLAIVRDEVYARLREGIVSQLEVLESDRTFLSSEQNLLSNHRQLLTDAVTLYKAMGGGWPKVRVGQASQ